MIIPATCYLYVRAFALFIFSAFFIFSKCATITFGGKKKNDMKVPPPFATVTALCRSLQQGHGGTARGVGHSIGILLTE